MTFFRKLLKVKNQELLLVNYWERQLNLLLNINQKLLTDLSVKKNENPVLMWLDSSLLFLGFISLLNGVTALITSKAPVYGLITTILSAAVAGLVMYMMYRYFYRPKADNSRRTWNWKGFAATTLSVLLWIAVTIFSGLLPTSVNLQLPAIALVIVGIVAFGVRWLLKRQFNIQSALVAQPRR